MRFVRLEQQRRQRRRQGQRDEGGDHRRDGDGERELTIELAGDSGNERRGYEHRRQHQRDGDQRRADLVHRAVRRLARREAAGDVALDVLDHDDGVVDDDADRQHQAEQGEVVERIPQRRHDRASADQRDRNRQDRDDRVRHDCRKTRTTSITRIIAPPAWCRRRRPRPGCSPSGCRRCGTDFGKSRFSRSIWLMTLRAPASALCWAAGTPRWRRQACRSGRSRSRSPGRPARRAPRPAGARCGPRASAR